MSVLLALALQMAAQEATTSQSQPTAEQATTQPAVADQARDPVSAAPVAPVDNPETDSEAEAATVATPSASTQTGPILWRNIASAMTVADLRALYPQGRGVTYKNDRTVLSDVPVIEGCEAKVNIMHPTGVVKEIVMRGEGSLAGRCSLKIITALSGKYGESLEKDSVHGSILARQGKNYVWTRDGITLQFKRYTSGALGGGGLFAASWELRYSANAANIDL